MEMRVIAYNEGRFIISKDIDVESIKGKEIMINIAPVLKYRDDDDVVGALLNIDYSFEGNSILTFGMIVSIHCDGINKLLKELEEDKIKGMLLPVWDVTLGVARGVMIEKTKDTPLENQFLPIVNLEEFSKVALLEKEVQK